VPALAAELQRNYPFLDPVHASRLAHAYGTRAARMLGDAKSAEDLGQAFGATLTAREVRYLMSSEWALTAEDVVWRRSKLGLRMSREEVSAIDDWIAAHRGQPGNSLREARA
jgi:glycerol-3-phosphate dehydrogenase